MSASQTDLENRLDIRIGATVRSRRDALGLTQAGLASAIGVTFQQVQKYERGTNRIAASKLILIADALKCDPSELLGEITEDMPGSGRLVRAWAGLDPRQREAVTRMIEAFGR